MRTALSLLFSGILGACSSPPAPVPDVSGASSLAVVAALTLDGHAARSVAVRDSVAAIGCGDGGLYLVDVSRPTQPVVLAHVEHLDATAVVFGTDALIVASAAGRVGAAMLQSVDVLDPRVPVVGDAFAATFDAEAGLCAEGGLVAATRWRDGPLVTDERRLDLAQARALVPTSTDDAVLLRRGLLFVHAQRWPWFGDPTHRLVIADADRGMSDKGFDMPGLPSSRGALGLVGDDLVCARAEAVDVVTSATTSAARIGLPLAIAGVTRIGADGARAVMLADGGTHLVLVEHDVAGQLDATAVLVLETQGVDVALAGSYVLVAAGAAGLVVVEIGRGGAP